MWLKPVGKSMLSDPIADFLTRIKNGYLAKSDLVMAPFSKVKETIAKVLEEHHFIGSSEKMEEKGKKYLKVRLLYEDKKRQKPALSFIRRISKPSLRVYKNAKKLKPVLGGYGITIISTSKGVMSNKKARAQNLGGEIICEVW